MVKILIVASAKAGKINVIVERQVESLRLTNIDIDIYPVNEKGILGYISNIPKLRNVLKNKNYNIIHAHYGLCGIISYFARQHEKIIVSFMGDDILGSNNSRGKVTASSKILAWISIFFANYLYDYSILKSKEMSKSFKNKEKFSLIPNGVDITIFKPLPEVSTNTEINFNKEIAHIVFLSNPLRTEKNYLLLQKASKLLQMPLEIHTYTDLNETELVNVYNQANVVVLCSFHEGSPNVIKEAMACNCPIVSTDVGDVNWVISGTKGCYISDFDPACLAQKIELAISYSRSQGRTNGRERIIQLGLDSESVAKKINAIYLKL
jgi:teichuronic acid biosynthesis glycosyltransferase TuaC